MVSDSSLPCFNALSALAVLKQSGQDVPFFLVSGVITEEGAAAARQAGAYDCVVKNRLAQLAPAIERALGEPRGQPQQANDALQRLSSELAAANKELDAFTYAVAHDLRAPLRAIDGFCQMLQSECGKRFGERATDLLGRMLTSAQQMRQLIDGLLSLSRITRSPINRRTVNLSRLAQTIADQLHQSAPERPADFAIQPHLAANGDPDLLRVVLTNLLGNAWKYSRKKPHTRIEFAAVPAAGATAYVVRDNGAGFDMAYVSKLFGVFQRLHSDREFEGTGVGLTIVQRIVHRHGGRVWAEGQVDHGAAFYFTLPGQALEVEPVQT